MKQEKVLVTGGTGFVAIHTIQQLLQQGYTVNTTVRTMQKKDVVVKALQEAGIGHTGRIHFFEADLNSNAGWAAAVAGCRYVLHVASPFPAGEPENPDELIIPARDGALRVLKAAVAEGVQRTVLTSSFAAVGYSNNTPGYVFTESDWTQPETPNRAYIRSKAIAEKAAWDFMEKEGGDMELSVINPVGIFGPALGGISSASLDTVITGIVEGQITETPPFTMGVVDVRDVADIHIKAMLHPAAAGERFLATSEGAMSFTDVAALIKKERPQLAGRMADLQPVDNSLYVHISAAKAAKLLNWHPRPKEEAILAGADSFYKP